MLTILNGKDYAFFFGITSPHASLYISEALDLILEHPYVLRSLDTMIIPPIAQKYQKQNSNISRIIYSAIHSAWKNHQKMVLEIMHDSLQKCPCVLEVLLRGYLLIQRSRDRNRYAGVSILEPLNIRVCRGYVYMAELIDAMNRMGGNFAGMPVSGFIAFLPSCAGVPQENVRRQLSRFLNRCRESGEQRYWRKLMPGEGKTNLSLKTFLKNVFILMDGQYPLTEGRTACPQPMKNAVSGYLERLGITAAEKSYSLIAKALQLCLEDSICFSSLDKYIFTPVASEMNLSAAQARRKLESSVQLVLSSAGSRFLRTVLAEAEAQAGCLSAVTFLHSSYRYFYKHALIDDFIRTKLIQWSLPVNNAFTYLAAALDRYGRFPSLSERNIFQNVADHYSVAYSSVSNKIRSIALLCWRGGRPDILSALPEAEYSLGVSFQLIAQSIHILRDRKEITPHPGN